MYTFSNFLSLLRAPLAFLFLFASPCIRIASILLAMITDSFDGFIARKSNTTSEVGKILDPVMDKFFFYFALIILLLEKKVLFLQGAMMLSRDFSQILFSFYLLGTKKWKTFPIQALLWGKVSTAFQFLYLILLSLNIYLPTFSYLPFVIFGILGFIDLVRKAKKIPASAI